MGLVVSIVQCFSMTGKKNPFFAFNLIHWGRSICVLENCMVIIIPHVPILPTFILVLSVEGCSFSIMVEGVWHHAE